MAWADSEMALLEPVGLEARLDLEKQCVQVEMLMMLLVALGPPQRPPVNTVEVVVRLSHLSAL